MSTALSAQNVINHAIKENRKSFAYISRGKLNMICSIQNRELIQIPDASSTQNFLNDSSITRQTTLDLITFQPHAHFKVTLDFKETQECRWPFTRETTDWVLFSCPGEQVFYDRNAERLVLQRCLACTSRSADMAVPLTIILKFDEDEWVAERVFGPKVETK